MNNNNFFSAEDQARADALARAGMDYEDAIDVVMSYHNELDVEYYEADLDSLTIDAGAFEGGLL